MPTDYDAPRRTETDDVDGAGLVVAAAPGIADELLAVLERWGGLDPIVD